MLKSQFQNKLIEAGCDEAGRGCLAGPVYAAAVILPKNYKNKLLNDSKKLSEKKRDLLRVEIERDAIAYGVGIVDNVEIDKINILNASFLAMHRAVKQLKQTPGLLLIDGNRFKPYPNIPHECIIKGDGKFLSIAAASVLAKTYRDEFMFASHEKHPEYAWNKNKGYPTKAHRGAIAEYGTTSIHRMTFRLLPEQLELDL
jgi:ribonuclease HII